MRVLGTAVWLAAAAAPMSLLLTAVQSPAPPQGIRILYPADHTVVRDSPRIIVAAPPGSKLGAALDGKPVPLRRMTFARSWLLPGRLKATAALIGDRQESVIWTANLQIRPGQHILEVGGKRLQIRSGKAAAMPGWTVAYSHPRTRAEGNGADCGGCHESAGDVLGPVSTPERCASCHDESAVQLIHRHVAEPLSRCANCHDPHGATRPKLLVADKAQLCRGCHESGHSKG